MIWIYRRWLTRFTPACPNPVSCSQYGQWAVREFGVLRGYWLAWNRVRACGQIAAALAMAGPGSSGFRCGMVGKDGYLPHVPGWECVRAGVTDHGFCYGGCDPFP